MGCAAASRCRETGRSLGVLHPEKRHYCVQGHGHDRISDPDDARDEHAARDRG